jgi:hypothetical protein
MLRIGLSRRPYMYQNCLSDRRGSLVYPFSSSSFAEEARAILLSVKCAVSACFIGQLNLRVIFSCASNMPGQELRLSNLNHTDIRSLVRQTLFRCGRSSIRVAFVFDGILVRKLENEKLRVGNRRGIASFCPPECEDEREWSSKAACND